MKGMLLSLAVVVTHLLCLSACDRDLDADHAQRAQRKATCPDLMTWAACAARGAAQARLAAENQEAARRASDASAVLMKQSAAMTADRREAWLRQCIQKSTCEPEQVDVIIAAAPQAEQAHATLIAFAALAEDIAKTAVDGSAISTAPAGLLAGLVARFGLALLGEMPPTKLRDARKDPDGSRGRVTSVTGNVIEIRKDGELFEGALATDDGTIVRFVTMMSTAGIYADKRAVFRGVFLQEFDYNNVSGGQTRALLYVGAFDLPENTIAVAKPAPADASGAIGATAPTGVRTVAVRVAPTVAATATAGSVTPAAALAAVQKPSACDPPFVIDAATGRKRYKLECLK